VKKNTPIKNTIFQKAAFKERFLAWVIDQLIIYGIFYLFAYVFFRFSVLHRQLISLILVTLYHTFFTWKSGQTPGKKIRGLKVVDLNYGPVSFQHAFLRESVGRIVSKFVFFVGYLWILISGKRQAWHDIIAKTYVVKLNDSSQVIPIKKEEIVTTKQKTLFGVLLIFVGVPLTIITILGIISLYFFKPFKVTGASMSPTYTNGSHILTSELAYNHKTPKRGDVVIFQYPATSSLRYIKRIIAIPGDRIYLFDGHIFLNNMELNEQTYLVPGTKTAEGKFLKNGVEVVIPANEYFVLGDNRAYSADSRSLGFIPRASIIGKVTTCYWNCPNHK
jgi:signal peptidase I